MSNYIQGIGSHSSFSNVKEPTSVSEANPSPMGQFAISIGETKPELLSKSKPNDSPRFHQFQLEKRSSVTMDQGMPDTGTNLRPTTFDNVSLLNPTPKFSTFKAQKIDRLKHKFNFHENTTNIDEVASNSSKNITENASRLTHKPNITEDQIVEVCLVEKDGSLTKLPSPSHKLYPKDDAYTKMDDHTGGDNFSSLEKSKVSKFNTLDGEEYKNREGADMYVPRIKAPSPELKLKLHQSIEEISLEPSSVYGAHRINDYSPSQSPEARRLNFNLSSLVTPVVNSNEPAPNQNQINREAQSSQSQQVLEILPEEEPIQNPVLSNIEAKLYLRRTLGFFVFMSLASMVALGIYNHIISYHGLYIISYIYLIYYIYENVKRIKSSEREEWRVRDDYFYAADGVMGIIFLAFLHLKQLQIFHKCTFVCIPFALGALAYCFLSKAKCGTKNTRAVVRVVAAAQILLITGKIDGQFDWEWKFIFAPAWAYLGVTAIYLVAYGSFLILLLLLVIFQQQQDEVISLPVQIMGFFWYFLYYGLAGIMALGIIGINDAYEFKDFEVLSISTWGNLGLNVFLFIYTLIIFKPLIRYIQVFSLTEGLLMNSDPPQIQAERQRQTAISLRPEKKQSYFVMLSPTYFLPLDNGLFSKNQDNIKRIKRMLERFQFKRLNAYKKSNYEEAKLMKPVDIETLREYKESLDKKFVKFGVTSPQSEEKQIETQTKGITRPLRDRNQTLRLPPLKVSNYKARGTYIDLESLDLNAKRHCSAADIEDMSPMKNPKRFSDEEKTCYVCYDQAANAVLMKCGHGGICFECATELVKKKNECMGCRAPVEAIIKIDPNPKFTDIIKGFEVNKVTQVEEEV